MQQPYQALPPPQQQGYQQPQQQQGYQQPPPQQGYPVAQQVPQQVMMMPPQQQMPPGVLVIHYIPRDAMTCCGGQPRRGTLAIMSNGRELCRLGQGQTQQIPVPAGMHTIAAEQTGVSGFFANLGGTSSSGQVICNVMPGATANVVVGWQQAGACSSKYYPMAQAR